MKRCFGTWTLTATMLVAPAGVVQNAHGQGGGPIWVSSPVTTATVGAAYESFMLAVDPTGQVVSYLPGSLPIWLNLTPVNAPVIYSVAGTLDRGAGGAATDAQLWLPAAGAYDATGNLYVADRNNHRVWRLSPSGLLTTFAGTGAPGFSGDRGAATRAQLFDPTSVAVGLAGEVYIADRQNHRIRRVTPDGMIMTVAGTGDAGFSGDGGPALDARLNNPSGVCVDTLARIVVCDTANNRLRAISTQGAIATIAGTGTPGYNGEGVPALSALLWAPWSVAAEPGGSFVFAEPGNNRVRRLGTDGLVSTVAGSGTFGSAGEGVPATQAQLALPHGVARDAQGGILIADRFNNRIRRVGTDGIIRTVAGTGAEGASGDGGPATSAQLASPEGVAVPPGGGFTVLDSDNDRVRFVDNTQTIQTVAGVGSFASSGDGGPATQAVLSQPLGGAYGPDGSFYLADTSGHAIRRIQSDATIVRVAGTGVEGFGGDNGPALSARLSSPADVAVDAAGNVFFSDSGNHRIRVVTTSGVILTFAGTGVPGDSGDGGPAVSATLDSPHGLAFDANGNLYVADQKNHRIRRIDTNGIIQQSVGNGEPGFAGDGGQAANARLREPLGVAVDAAGALYVGDTGNHRVRHVSPGGVITTIAGNGVPGFGGDGGSAAQAQLSAPAGLGVASDGSVYVADSGNHRVRAITPAGSIQTFAGSGGAGPGGGGHTGDGGPPSEATLLSPFAVELRADGEVAIVEAGLGFVRKVFPAGTVLAGTPPPGSEGLQAVNVVAEAGASTTSQDFTILVESRPNITVQPASQQVPEGSLVTFSVTASGSTPLSYQWMRNGALLSDTGRITGTASSQLSIAGAQPSDVAGYQVIVLNAAGSVTSATATLTLGALQPPSIIQPPQSQGAFVGSAVQFTVIATGTEPLSYQWLREGVPLTEDGRFQGTRTTQLTIFAVNVGDSGAYSVTVQNAAGSITSEAALLTVDTRTPPTIAQQPGPQEVPRGADALFAVVASGTEPIVYEWRKDGVPLVESAHFVGVATPQLRVVAADIPDEGDYTVVAQNFLGAVTSVPARLTIQPEPPVITSQPQSQMVPLGASVSFAVGATGTEPLAYQWSREGVPLTEGGRFAGTQTPELTVSNVEAADAGSYTVTVQNVAGTVTSDPATLTVDTRTAPQIVEQPQPQTVSLGADALFAVVASGTEPLAYQWRKDGLPLVESGHLVGVATAQLRIVGTETADEGDYAVLVSNALGSVASSAARLTVQLQAPTITTQPQSQTAIAGSTATFQVEAAGSPPLTYQWSRNGMALADNGRIAGTQTAELSITEVTAEDAGDYTVTVQNAGGTVTSTAATLTIAPVSPPVISEVRLKGNLISFLVSGPPGAECVIEYSSLLERWGEIGRITLEEDPVEFTDLATTPSRYYRARLP